MGIATQVLQIPAESRSILCAVLISHISHSPFRLPPVMLLQQRKNSNIVNAIACYASPQRSILLVKCGRIRADKNAGLHSTCFEVDVKKMTLFGYIVVTELMPKHCCRRARCDYAAVHCIAGRSCQEVVCICSRWMSGEVR